MVFDYRDGNHNAYMGPPEARYKSLQNPHTRIRLAYLHAGSWPDPVAVTLRVHLRSNRPIFVALSYTWGASTAGNSILLNGSYFAVTDNLHAALRRLRLSDRSRVLWIDAICIDQADTTERAAQIKAMQSIYRSAVRVIVWLGEGIAPQQNDKFRHEYLDAEQSRPRAKLDNAMRSAKPWWHERIWTLQEFISANKAPIFLFADQAKTLPKLQSMLSESDSSSPLSRSQRLAALTQALADRQQVLTSLADVELSLIDRFLILCLAITGTEATDPRDHVYAVLNLMSQRVAYQIKVSYLMTPAALFTMSTSAAIEGIGSLVPLALKRLRPARSMIQETTVCEGLPSWALDFSNIADIRSHTTKRMSGVDTLSMLLFQLGDTVRFSTVTVEPIYDEESERLRHILSFPGVTMHDRIREVVSLRIVLLTAGHGAQTWTGGRRHMSWATGGTWLYQTSRGSILRSAVLRSGSLYEGQSRPVASLSFLDALEKVLDAHFSRSEIMSIKQENRCAGETRGSDPRLRDGLEYWLEYLNAVSGHAVFFTTDNGRYGVASSATQVGDRLATLPSMKAPAVLSCLDIDLVRQHWSSPD
ncbi:hypothetical protein LTR86_002201 [Recurvomyces mirabilis]|nr:hypothetical protein LTR86_002201 [Recurvomyces mirabilis]